MRNRKVHEMICEICGQKYLSHSLLSMYCPDCKTKVAKIKAQDRKHAFQAREEVKAEVKAEKKRSMQEIVKEAEKHHMTYGQYVALSEVVNGLS